MKKYNTIKYIIAINISIFQLHFIDVFAQDNLLIDPPNAYEIIKSNEFPIIDSPYIQDAFYTEPEIDFKNVIFSNPEFYIEDESNIEIYDIQKFVNPKANQIVSYASNFLGTPYLWGGTNLTTGVDCSGFVYQILKDNGISINRTSSDQILNGTEIYKYDLLPGDLVFFDTNGQVNTGNISHVGIFIGNDQFIHAASERNTPYVKIDSLSSEYYTKSFVSARRVLK
jgi:hypothetical protein